MIPVTVLTGFLGSGKTTLLNHLLRQPEFARTAVIINEFGETGLDHDLVEPSDDSLVELATGCLCCKVRDDLARTLDDLLRRRDAGTVPPFTRVVIETSGLADPVPILQTLITDASASARLALAAVVTTVEAVSGAATLDREPLALRQVALADRIVLTKSDLLEAVEPGLVRRLAETNPAAPRLVARHGRIGAGALFDGGFPGPHGRSFALEPGTGPHVHGHAGHDGIESCTIFREQPIRAATLALLIETLAEHCGADLLRLKGIVGLLESPDRPAVIHGVRHVFHAPAFLARWPSADRRSRIVVIARAGAVPRGWLEALIDALEAEVAEIAAAGVP
ncbi:MAG TPA: GTP-binding protein [Xanthobacteraceae bacterium]